MRRPTVRNRSYATEDAQAGDRYRYEKAKLAAPGAVRRQ